MRPGHGLLVYGHLPPARIALRPWFKDRQLRALPGSPRPRGGRGTVNEHPRRPHEAPAQAPRDSGSRSWRVTRCPASRRSVFDGNPDDGLTVGLWVESQGRRDVLDLARVSRTSRRSRLSRLVAPRSEPQARVLAAAPPRELRAARDLRFHRPLRRQRSSERPDARQPCRSSSPRTVSCSTSTAGSIRSSSGMDRTPVARECVFEVLSASGA